jgi:hypothetical protein
MKSQFIIRYFGRKRDVTIGSSIESLGPSSFRDYDFPSAVNFELCSKFARVGDFSFSDTSMTSIRIPASVEILGQSCFLHCRSLSTVHMESNSKLTRIEKDAFSSCTSLKSICIPPSVAALGEHSLYDFVSLKVICIPPSVEIIGEYCFAECTSLSALTFNSGSRLAHIAESAFSK